MFMVRWFLSDKPVNKPAKSLSTHKSTESILPINPNSAESKDIMVPGDVINIMLGYANLEVSGHSIRPLVSTLFNSVKTKKLRDLRDLLTAIVNGRPDEAKAILDRDSSLVLERLEDKEVVTARSGHQFNLQPYPAALSVGDTQMAEMIRSYFAMLKEEREADRQYDEQNPTGWEKAEEEKWKPIFKQRDKLLRVIRDSKTGDITSSGKPNYIATARKGSPVEKELLAFWGLLDATLNEVITAGKRPFPPNLLLQPLQKYDDDKLYKQYFGGRWDDPRALFFVQKVVGYEGIQRLMPVNYVQAYQDWLEETVAKLQANQPQKRGTSFEIYGAGNWESVDFYPLRARGTAGFNFMVYGGEAGGFGAQAVCFRTAARGGFQFLCQTKTSNLQSLCGLSSHARRLAV